MDSASHKPGASPTDAAASYEIAQLAARRAARAACGTASPLQAAAAAPVWRALSDGSALWLHAVDADMKIGQPWPPPR
jgi:hypothetical protein